MGGGVSIDSIHVYYTIFQNFFDLLFLRIPSLYEETHLLSNIFQEYCLQYSDKLIYFVMERFYLTYHGRHIGYQDKKNLNIFF